MTYYSMTYFNVLCYFVCLQNVDWLEQELNTWRLLLTLFQVQHLEPEEVNNIVSERDLADALFKEDQKLKGVIFVF